MGGVWATKKEKSLEGSKFIVDRIYEPDTDKLGDVIVASDYIGAGISDIVLITTGSSTREIGMDKDGLPVDATVVGIVDQVNLK